MTALVIMAGKQRIGKFHLRDKVKHRSALGEDMDCKIEAEQPNPILGESLSTYSIEKNKQRIKDLTKGEYQRL